MATEEQKYLSVTLRNVGFAFLAPFGSIIFQWIVFKQGGYFEHLFYSVLVLFIGFILISIGYMCVIEKKDEEYE